MKLKIGDIFLVRNYGLLGWIIRKATKSRHNHCCLYIGNGVLVDTDFFGVRYRRLSAYDKIPHKIVRVRNVPVKIAHKVCKYARKLTGKRYSILSIFRVKNKLGETYNCAQLVNCVYAKYGIILSDKFIKLAPADIGRSKLTYTVRRERKIRRKLWKNMLESITKSLEESMTPITKE